MKALGVEFSLDFFTAENLNMIKNALKDLLVQIEDYMSIITAVDGFLGLDISAYETMADFAYEGSDTAKFVDGLWTIVAPIEGILDWLLFGESYEFFFQNQDIDGNGTIDDLIVLAGGNGYEEGLAYLLEAIVGETMPAVVRVDGVVDTEATLKAILNKVLAVVTGLLNKNVADGIDFIFDLLTELVYFINANGISVALLNTLGVAYNLVGLLNESGLFELDLNALLTGLLNYPITIEKTDLKYVFGLVENFTGLMFNDVVTTWSLDKFYMGEIVSYTSASGETAFRMQFSDEDTTYGAGVAEDKADFITILVSFLLEAVMFEGNQDVYTVYTKDGDNWTATEETAVGYFKRSVHGDEIIIGDIKFVYTETKTVNNGAVLSDMIGSEDLDLSKILALLERFGLEFQYIEFDWNYMGGTIDPDTKEITLPANAFKNYLTYGNNWSEEVATGLDAALVDIVLMVLGMSNENITETSTVNDLITELAGKEFSLYTAENLNAIHTAIADLLVSIEDYMSIVAAVDGLLGVDIEAYKNLEEATFTGSDRTAFIAGLVEIVKPLEGILSWLLFNDSFAFFHDDATGQEDLIEIAGAQGYKYGLGVLLEALGIVAPDVDDIDTFEGKMTAILNALADFIDSIFNKNIRGAVDQILGLLPNLIYFINANGLSVAVINLLAAAYNLIDALNESGMLDLQLNKVLSDLLFTDETKTAPAIDIEKIDLLMVFGIVEYFTGLEFIDVVTADKLDKFYIGQINKYDSVAEWDAYKMTFADTYTDYGVGAVEDRADFITILVSFLLEVIMYGDNAKVLDEMINAEGFSIAGIVNLLTNLGVPSYLGYNWNYMEGDAAYDADSNLVSITLPATAFKNYLTYENDWSEETAETLIGNLPTLLVDILALIDSESTITKDSTVEDLIVSFTGSGLDLFTAANLNSIKTMLTDLLKEIEDYMDLITAVDSLLGLDIAAYETMADFDYTGSDIDKFVDGLVTLLAPISGILGWLLFGDEYAFFHKNNTDADGDGVADDLLVLPGAEGYKYGLGVLLEALTGTTAPSVDGLADNTAKIDAVLSYVGEFIGDVMAMKLPDAIDFILSLVAELLYFINANGISVALLNLLAAAYSLVDTLTEEGIIDLNLNELLSGLLFEDADENGEPDYMLDIENTNLLVVFEIVEYFTGLEFTDVVGNNKLQKFYIGEITAYDSVAGYKAFRMGFADEMTTYGAGVAEDKADLVTILLSFVIECLLYEGNAAAIDQMIGSEDFSVVTIVELIEALGIPVDYRYYNWAYMDGAEVAKIDGKLVSITLPTDGFKNYLTYANNWTEEAAEGLMDELPGLLISILGEGITETTTVNELIVELSGNGLELFTAANLNSLKNALIDLLAGLDDYMSIITSVDGILGVDLGAYTAENMPDYTFEGSSSEQFVDGLVEILAPISGLVDFLFFGGSYEFFYYNETYYEGRDDLKDLITVAGAEGYKYGLAVLLEALGVNAPDVDGLATTEEKLDAILTAVANFIDMVLGMNINQVIDFALDLITNLLYFINANGVSVAVINLLGSVYNAVEDLNASGLLELNINELLSGLLFEDADEDGTPDYMLDIENINLLVIIEVVEQLLGIEVTEWMSEMKLKNFYMGEITAYDSVAGYKGFKMSLADQTVYGNTLVEDQADLVTIIISFALELLLFPGNAEVIDEMIGSEDFSIAEIVAIIRQLGINITYRTYNWNYMNGEATTDANGNITSIVLPTTAFKNYLTYENDWSEETAEALFGNLPTLLVDILALIDSESTITTDSTVEDLIVSFTGSGLDIFTADLLNDLKTMLVDLLASLEDYMDLVVAVDGILGVDLAAYETMADFNYIGSDIDKFVDGLVTLLAPISGLLGWLLFGDSYAFFHYNDTDADGDGVADDLLVLPGAEGYKYGLGVFLEALTGKTAPSVEGLDNVAAIDAVLTYVGEFIKDVMSMKLDEAITFVLSLVAELLYFINANGLSVMLLNLLASAYSLVETLQDKGILDLDLNELLSGLLFEDKDGDGELDYMLNIENTNLLVVFEIVEYFTGLEFTDVVTNNKLLYFYIGEITAYDSVAGYTAFRMGFSDENTAYGAGVAEDKADLFTILISFVLEVLFFEDNAAIIDGMIGSEDFSLIQIVELIKGLGVRVPQYMYYNWNYMEGNATAVDGKITSITLPTDRFKNYLTYANNWDEATAETLMAKLPSLLVQILEMTGTEGITADATVNEIIATLSGSGLSLFTADNLNSLKNALINLLADLDDYMSIITAVDGILGIDLGAYTAENMPDFTFEGSDSAAFVDGLVTILAPISGLLDWLLFGGSYEFFHDNATGDEDLLVLAGAEGYKYGLAVLLEALGIEAPVVDGYATAAEKLDAILTAVAKFIDDALAMTIDEVIDFALDLITNLLYFINANGVSVALLNLLAAVYDLVKVLGNEGILDLDLNELLSGLLFEDADEDGKPDYMLDIENTNLLVIIEVVEILLGLEVTDWMSEYKLSHFYMGEINSYDSVAGYKGFKMNLADQTVYGNTRVEDQADLVTIILSFALELLLYPGNAEVIDEMIGADGFSVAGIVELVRGLGDLKYTIKAFDWNYFGGVEGEIAGTTSEDGDPYITYTPDDGTFVREFKNYLTYGNNWSEATAEMLDKSLFGIVEMVLEMSDIEADTVGDFLAADFTLYKAEYLNTIKNALQDLLGNLSDYMDLISTVDGILGVDLTAYETMPDFAEFTDDKPASEQFIDGLYTILQPVEGLVAWLLFGESYEFFYYNEKVDGKPVDLIVLAGADGYTNGLALILEALGVQAADISGLETTEAKFKAMLTPIVEFIDDILNGGLEEAIDKALALIVNLLYFINANGLSSALINFLAAAYNIVNLLNSSGLVELDLDELLGGLLFSDEEKNAIYTIDDTFSIEKTNLLVAIQIVEYFTGLNITGAVAPEKISGFYMGHVEEYASVADAPAFKMLLGKADGEPDYATTLVEDRADFITILVSFLLEVVLYDANALAIDELLGTDGMVAMIVALVESLGNFDIEYVDFNWNYMNYDETDENADKTAGYVDSDGDGIYDEIKLPANRYINYFKTYTKNDWTEVKAEYLASNIDDIVADIMYLINGDESSIADLLGGAFNIYQAEYLEAIATAIPGLLSSLDEGLVSIIGLVLGVDLTAYAKMHFVAESEVPAGTTYDANEFGLYYIADGATYYVIRDAYAEGDFINGLCAIVNPIESALSWLLFGGSYAFFHHNDTDEDGDGVADDLLVIAGADGYTNGLAVLLEALGVKAPRVVYNAEGEIDATATLKAVLTALADRISEILADPIDNVIALIPNLLYFINSNGLSVAILNTLASVYNALAIVQENGAELGIDEETLATLDLNTLISGLLSDTGLELDLENTDLLTVFNIVESLVGLELTDVVGTLKIDDFYLGQIKSYDSVSDFEAFKMSYSAEEDAGDMLTIILSFLIEAVLYQRADNPATEEDESFSNAVVLDEMLGLDGMIAAVVNFLTSDAVVTYSMINWNYMNGTMDADGNITLPTERFIHYLKYENDWSEATSEYIFENLDAIVQMVFDIIYKDEETQVTVSDLILGFFNPDEDLYTAEILQSLVDTLKDLIDQLGESLLQLVGVILGADLSIFQTKAFADYDETATYAYDAAHDLYYVAGADGVDTYAIADRDDFVSALCMMLEPVYGILDWLLFGGEIALFVDSETGEKDLIKLVGAHGFMAGFVPLLETLFVDMGTISSNTDGEYDTAVVLPQLLYALMARIDEILADPINEVLALIPNLLYNINAGTISALLKNLLGSIYGLLDAIGQDLSVDALIKDLIGIDNEYFSIENFSLMDVFYLVKHFTGIEVAAAVYDESDPVEIDDFYLGVIEQYESSNTMTAYRMVFPAESTDYVVGGTVPEDRADLLAIIVGLLVDVINFEGNREAINALIGEGTWEAIYAVLHLEEFEMQKFDWLYAEYADTGMIFAPVKNSVLFKTAYGKYFTKEMANNIVTHFEEFVDIWIRLLGIESLIDGMTFDNLEDLVNELLNEYLYTADISNKLLDALTGLLGKIDAIDPDGYILGLVKELLGVDLSKLAKIKIVSTEEEAAQYNGSDFIVYIVTKGDTESFIDALTGILDPLAPLLEWLLCNKPLSFFYDHEGYDAITLLGGEGYAYAIIPLLEALGCPADSILTPAEYYAAAEADPANMIRNILRPIAARLADFAADPAMELLELLPALIYFINSNGADTVVKNLLHGVFGVLDALQPLLGDVNAYELVGIPDLGTLDFQGILELALSSVEEDLGMEIVRPAYNAILEFTHGEIVSFQSKNGEIAYTMKYNDESADRGDMITVLLRFVLNFATLGDNITAIKKMLQGSVNDEAFKFLCALLDNLKDMASKADGVDKMLYTIYYIFYGLYHGGKETLNWLDDKNDNFRFLCSLMKNSKDDTLSGLYNDLDKFVDDNDLGPIVNPGTDPDSGIAPEGQISFWQKIIEFFQKIADWFKNLFGG
ncbi:MAG: hypothetical protein IJO14_05535 [Clostridia bacterium]|nr:hypothetical protein [Clostridia bacterium]